MEEVGGERRQGLGMMLYYTSGRVGVGVGVGSLCLEAIECLEGEGGGDRVLGG